MLEYQHITEDPVTASKKQSKLTDDEYAEMAALKNVINQAPQTVVPEKMEQFTEYLVRSLRERGG